MLILVTGATGKVGQAFLTRFLGDGRWPDAKVRALCHNRTLPPDSRIECVRGSIADRETVEQAMKDVTHVFHMATVKEDPVQAMDVSVKGMFFLLEAFRTNPAAQQFVLIGGDCSVGTSSTSTMRRSPRMRPCGPTPASMRFRRCSKRRCSSRTTRSTASTG